MDRTPNGRQGTHLILGVCAAIGLAAPGAGQPRDRPTAVTGTAGISGRVLTGSSPSPLGDAVVTARAENGKITESAVTDAEGRFALTGLPAGRYILSRAEGAVVEGLLTSVSCLVERRQKKRRCPDHPERRLKERPWATRAT